LTTNTDGERKLSSENSAPVESFMPTQEELAFFKAIAPMIVEEMKRTLAAGGIGQARPAEKRKATDLAFSADSSEPATRRPTTGAGQTPLEQHSSDATGEQVASGDRHLKSPEGGMTCAAVVAAPVAPQKQSGPLKLIANGLDSSEPVVSSETATRRMSSDMSGPLSGTPIGTTENTHLTNTSLPVGQPPNKTPIFISGVADTRAFLAWLRASCLSDLTAQLKAEKLMVVPSTADGFRATVSALRSLEGGEGVSFHTFSLPENRCVRLLVKNFGQGMPENAVRKELESPNIQVQGVMQLRSGRRDQDPAKDRPPTLHFIDSLARDSEVSKVR
jgi:hypothetical protein